MHDFLQLVHCFRISHHGLDLQNTFMRHFWFIEFILTSPIQLADASLDCTEDRTATTWKAKSQEKMAY